MRCLRASLLGCALLLPARLLHAQPINPGGGGGGSAVWGDITGTLSDQTDLQSALDAKANTTTLSGVPATPYLSFPGVSPYGPVSAFTKPGAVLGEASCTLNGAINNSVTTIHVSSSAGFPLTPFVVSLGSEDIRVNTVSGTTWTVVRGYDGTSAASHSDGAFILLLNWQWVNQGTASVLEFDGALYLSGPAVAGVNLRVLKQIALAPPYTITAYVQPVLGTPNSRAGLCLRESSSGKLVTFTLWGSGSSGTPGWEFAAWNSPTSFNTNTANGFSTGNTQGSPIQWIRIVDDGSTRHMQYSADGFTFVEVANNSDTQFCTPDEVGLAVYPDTANGAGIGLVSWTQTSP